jgi:hypothetical protein
MRRNKLLTRIARGLTWLFGKKDYFINHRRKNKPQKYNCALSYAYAPGAVVILACMA